ncbi:hypothetical protein E2320_020791 [Naja naja]|nr:hypothetical protein E2320_020791 [Naja naja]
MRRPSFQPRDKPGEKGSPGWVPLGARFFVSLVRGEKPPARTTLITERFAPSPPPLPTRDGASEGPGRRHSPRRQN